MAIAKGIVMAATAPRFVREATIAIHAIRKVSELPITLFVADAQAVEPTVPVDEVRVVEKPTDSFHDKFAAILGSPYEWTCYLDCDTLAIDEMAFSPFRALERCALAVSPAAGGNGRFFLPFPTCYPGVDSGVLYYRQDARPLLEDWERRHQPPRSPDHLVLGKLLWDQPEWRFYCLPPGWAYRGFYRQVPGLGEVHLIHSREAVERIRNDGLLSWWRAHVEAAG